MGDKGATWWLDATLADSYIDGSSRDALWGDGVELKRRSESSHLHADYRIKTGHATFDRIDAILALKRSMQTRLDHLDSLYGFSQYPESRSIGWLGLLEHWGVIRKRMLHRMKQLRNAVEHDGAEPPTLDECEDYAEVTWWFLRGTSPLLAPMDSIDYNGAFHGSVHYEYSPLKIRVTGSLSTNLISAKEVSGWSKAVAFPIRYGENKGVMSPVQEEDNNFEFEGYVTDPVSAHAFLKNAFSELL
ncbi:hypothetical protein [Streptomyces sp. NPDC060198]|uniref:hypothetical protein n=1 Tax=Streptomyces sp. NPDC060198 TaxID=3347070 RepID=UPI00366621E8